MVQDSSQGEEGDKQRAINRRSRSVASDKVQGKGLYQFMMFVSVVCFHKLRSDSPIFVPGSCPLFPLLGRPLIN